MSNRPPIYAHCKAGCSWETVHKDDFLNTVAFIRQKVIDNGFFKQFYLAAGQTVILKGDIFADTTDGRYSKATYEIRDVNNNVYVTEKAFMVSRFSTYIRVKNCGAYEEEDGTRTFYYELQGIGTDSSGNPVVKYYHTCKVSDTQIVIRLMNVDEVYLVNDGMEEFLNAEEVSV